VPDKISRLVRDSKSGNRKAFGELYEMFVGRIYNYMYYRTFHRETAEDLTGLTFLKVLKKFDTYQEKKGSFLTWIYRIAGNCLIDHYRTHRKTENIENIRNLSTSEDIETNVEARIKWEQLKPFLEALPFEKSNIIIMRIWDGLSYKEIAGILKKSEGACKMMFARTINQLKKAIPFSFYFMVFALPVIEEEL